MAAVLIVFLLTALLLCPGLLRPVSEELSVEAVIAASDLHLYIVPLILGVG